MEIPIHPVTAQNSSKKNIQYKKYLQEYPGSDMDKDGVLTKKELQDHKQKIYSEKKAVEFGLKVERGVLYKEVDKQNIGLDIFFPKNNKYKKAPLGIYIHGGGFSGGDKTKLGGGRLPVINMLCEAGFLCISINYRLTMKGQSTLDNCIIDCKDAIRYFHKNKERYKVDPDRAGVFGGSAGAHLALAVGVPGSRRRPERM